uniref:Uncharacterized protein n=1 Tax=Micrurus paraensis TaxID=1970185 RepID=A0A2D4KBH2_9SAUR
MQAAGKLTPAEWAAGRRRLVFASLCLPAAHPDHLPSPMPLPHLLSVPLCKDETPVDGHISPLLAFPWCARITCHLTLLPAAWTGDQQPSAMQAAAADGHH